MSKSYGLAGKLAQAFLHSKLTPIMILVSVLLGLGALQMTPREEEPQIIVPMVDVFFQWPGHDPDDMERLLASPVEDALLDIAGLEYVYSLVFQDHAMFVVRFEVGYPVEDALVHVRQTLSETLPTLPEGVMQPTCASRSIDDVPVFAVTLWTERDVEEPATFLTHLAHEVAEDLRKESNVSDVVLIGDQDQEWFVEIDPDAMVRYGLSAGSMHQQLQAFLGEMPLTRIVEREGEQFRSESLRLKSSVDTMDALRAVSLNTPDGRKVFLGDVADVVQRTIPLTESVWYSDVEHRHEREAVTVAVSKRPGTNASDLTHRLQSRMSLLQDKGLVPDGVHYEIVRDYGHTAKEKSDELIKHLLIATLSVVALIALALGFRESIVVAIAVPVTLALTLLLAYLLGFTINRVTLFALIFSIGILVDDAIVVVENIHRHAVMKDGRSWARKILDAVNEVGNPTILATFTVIAAILPMAYVGGLMGPYMLPIPILASLAMLFSLVIAFVVSPWAAVRLMKHDSHNSGSGEEKEGFLNRLYRKVMNGLLGSPVMYWGFLLFTAVLFMLAASLVAFRLVEVKMLPFDNKNEVQVVIDMPEGTLLEDTAKVAFELNQALLNHEQVVNTQIYVGTSSPYTFNGLVRHYFLRNQPHEADIAVTLRDRHARRADSHEVAKELRNLIAGIGQDDGANVKVVEIPPGPPVLSTLVAEVYGPDLATQRRLAHEIRAVMEEVDGVVDVDTYEADDQMETEFEIDPTALRRYGVNPEVVRGELMAVSHGVLGFAPQQFGRTPMMVRMGLERPIEEDADKWKLLPVWGSQGQVPLSALVQEVRGTAPKPIYRKNSQRVIYVIGEVAGAIEAPVYALTAMNDRILAKAEELGIDDMPILNINMPDSAESYMMKWDGEWHITVEVFRDMGIAFAAVLILIYLLVVGWFRSFTVPLVILSPVPLSLVGILPGHWMFGAFFTATSMIGFIAGAGIIVRNSIILVDFIQLKQREGMDLNHAVVEAGVVRFRPMLLTASAVVVGAAVILFDPIFQGLAISLMMGEVAATLLSRIAVPLLYVGLNRIHPVDVMHESETVIE